MIGLKTPAGNKSYILRGILTPGGSKAIANGYITTPGGDNHFWDNSLASLTVEINPSYAQGGAAVNAPVTVDTGSVTASASGGTPPYTYEWTVDTVDGAGWSVVSPSAATTKFRCSGVVAAAIAREATFECTVTDARGATGTDTVFATVFNYGWEGY